MTWGYFIIKYFILYWVTLSCNKVWIEQIVGILDSHPSRALHSRAIKRSYKPEMGNYAPANCLCWLWVAIVSDKTFRFAFFYFPVTIRGQLYCITNVVNAGFHYRNDSLMNLLGVCIRLIEVCNWAQGLLVVNIGATLWGFSYTLLRMSAQYTLIVFI